MKYLLIPSAILVPPEMQNQLGEIPSALFPLGKTTILEHIYEKYRSSVDGIYLIANEKKYLLEDYILWKKMNISLVDTCAGGTLGNTLLAGIDAIHKDHPEGGNVIINFGDTLLNDISAEELTGDTICYAEHQSSNEWTFFEETEGTLVSVSDKSKKASEENIRGKIFVGTFSFADSNALLECLKKARIDQNNRVDSFYKALMQYSISHPFRFYETKQWLDTGHSENYFQAKTGVAARAFNSISIDENRGIMVKRSQNVDKFIGEINWYLKMPSNLQYLLPRIYSYSLDRANPYIQMEYYGYHTLHEMLVYGDLPLLKWQKLLQKIKFILNDMERFKVTAEDDSLLVSMREIYIDKTLHRLKDLAKQSEFTAFFEKPFVINGVEYSCLNEIMKRLPTLIEKLVIESFDGYFTIIHGDLCFANILVEDKYNYMRLIDPRGKFGKYDIYGDPRYELAKLMHTLEGNYDYIIEDMFTVERIENTIQYTVPTRSEKICQLFYDVFSNSIEDLRSIRMIEATLFLSMIPLHNDHLERQYAMLATGMELLREVMDNE